MEINRETLTNFLSVATYGNSSVYVYTLKKEKELDKNVPEELLVDRAREERWADRLLNGGHVAVVDCYEFDDGTPEEECTKLLTLEDFKAGFEKAKEIVPRHWADLETGNDDAVTGDVIFQVIRFGDVIYG